MEKIKDMIKRNYGIDCINITRQIGGWSALAYKFADETNNYFLKIYDKGRASTPKLTALIDQYIPITIWLNDNTALKGKIPIPILTNEGKIITEDDDGIYLLFKYINGETIGSKQLSKEQISKLATIISILHSYTEKTPFETDAIKEDFNIPFLSDLRNILSKEMSNIPKDLKELLEVHIESIEYLTNKIEILSKMLKSNKLKMVLCHTDIHNWNLMQTSQELVLVDWEGLKLAPPEADLMFIVDKPYYSLFMDIYCKRHRDFKVNQEALSFYKIRRKLEDIWEFIEQLLFDNQDKESRMESLYYLTNELENHDLFIYSSGRQT